MNAASTTATPSRGKHVGGGPATVLVVPGAFHTGWCWAPVMSRLADVGVEARVIDLPFTSYRDDVAAVATAVVAQASRAPVVLVGHSYSGLILTEVGGVVSHLVYVAARMPAAGSRPAAETDEWSDARFRATWSRGKDGAYRLQPAAADLLYNCSPRGLAELAARHWVPLRSEVPERAPDIPAWSVVASTYVVCTDDLVARVDTQRDYASRATAHIEIASDHSPFLSAPGELSRVLAETAAAVR